MPSGRRASRRWRRTRRIFIPDKPSAARRGPHRVPTDGYLKAAGRPGRRGRVWAVGSARSGPSEPGASSPLNYLMRRGRPQRLSKKGGFS